MLFQVFLQTTILWKGFLTYITWKEFHTWVCSQMFVKVPPSEKSFGHRMQGYGFSPECILICPFKSPPCEKAVGHWLQEYAFFTWICSDVLLQITSIRKVFLTLIARMRFFFWTWWHMILNLILSEKAFRHRWHWCGFSPECILLCILKLTPCEKAFWHWLQRYLFSVECVYILLLIAHIWFIIWMSFHVHSQISFYWESFWTLIARKWFLTWVCSHVHP